MKIIYEGATVAELKREELSSIIGEDLIDEKATNERIDDIANKMNLNPVNAYIDDYGTIVPEQLGVKLNKKELKQQLYRFFYTRSPHTIEVPTENTYPRVDSELLANIRTKKLDTIQHTQIEETRQGFIISPLL